MKLNAYAVFDNKALRYLNPFFMQSHPEAIRAFGDNCLNKETTWNKYPTDYDLYFIGYFDQENAELNSLPTPPHFIARALDFVKLPILTPAELKNGLSPTGDAILSK